MTGFDTEKNYIKNTLSADRYQHSLSVADTAVKIGKELGLSDPELRELYTAGILHDMSKEKTASDQLEIIKRGNGTAEPDDIAVLPVLHQIAGAYEARLKFGVNDAVFGMIRYHCTGKPGMSICESIVFVADYIEPLRKHQDCVELNRRFFSRPVTEESIKAAVKECCKNTIERLKIKKYSIHHLTLDTYNA